MSSIHELAARVKPGTEAGGPVARPRSVPHRSAVHSAGLPVVRPF